MNLVVALVAACAIAAVGIAASAVSSLRVAATAGVLYVAIVVFLAGIVWRVLAWARTPVPFRIPTTAGQQRSLPWLKASRLEAPSTTLGVVGRMALEVLLFRSLFRNTTTELRPDGPRMVYGEEKLLWLAAVAFHWSFLVIFLRHLRFFLEPVPALVNVLSAVDGFFQVGVPPVYATDVFVLVALGYLLYRRAADTRLRYMSLVSDYLALLLIIGLAGSGVLMRYFAHPDIVAIKQVALGVATFAPVVPASVGALFFVHLFFLSALLVYFPFSKLVHMAGIFLSPTRNLANNNRTKRHVNPWNYPVKVHTYEEWEDEFRDKIKAAGLPLERAEKHG
jgi:nitrate reductase gamma subunit